MNNSKTTKRALFSSVIALILCFSMLLGTTFAWFTDEVVSSGNKIISGTLDVDLYHTTDPTGTWTEITESKEAIFTYDNWEPGYVDVHFLEVQNNGTLALKWKAALTSKNALSNLAEVIDVYVKEFADRNAAVKPVGRDLEAAGWTKLGTLKSFIETIETTTTGELTANTAEALGIAFKMQESAGNTYQDKKLGEFDIYILATQMMSESDSFGITYDEKAEYPTVSGDEQGDSSSAVTVTPENLSTTTFEEGKTYKLSGTFTEETIILDLKHLADKDIVIDGEEAVFDENVKNIKFNFGIQDGLSTIVTNGEFDAKSGVKTVKNFNLPKASLSVGAISTTVNITGNTAKTIDADASNCNINVSENVVDTDEAYSRFDGGTNDKSFYMLAVNYNLSLENNSFTNTVKDTISINGRGEWDSADFVNKRTDGSIEESKIKNTITLNGNTLTAERRALYIWGDHTFGSNHTLTNASSAADLADEAKALVSDILSETVTANGGFVGFGGLYLDRTACEALTNN